MAETDPDPIEMSKGVKNDLEDTLDYSKLLSNVISNDIGSALGPNNRQNN